MADSLTLYQTGASHAFFNVGNDGTIVCKNSAGSTSDAAIWSA